MFVACGPGSCVNAVISSVTFMVKGGHLRLQCLRICLGCEVIEMWIEITLSSAW